MGKLKALHVMIIGVILIVIIGAAIFFLVIKPAKEELARVTAKRDERKQVAARLDQAKAALKEAKEKAAEAKAKLQVIKDTKTVPITFKAADPHETMIALWHELREDFPPQWNRFLESFEDVDVLAGQIGPQPVPDSPPAPQEFYQEAAPQVQVRGSFEAVKDFIRHLKEFQRLVSFNSIQLTGAEGGDVIAAIPVTIFLMTEVPAGAGGAAAAGGAMPGAMPGMGAMPPGMGAMPPGAEVPGGAVPGIEMGPPGMGGPPGPPGPAGPEGV